MIKLFTSLIPYYSDKQKNIIQLSLKSDNWSWMKVEVVRSIFAVLHYAQKSQQQKTIRTFEKHCSSLIFNFVFQIQGSYKLNWSILRLLWAEFNDHFMVILAKQKFDSENLWVNLVDSCQPGWQWSFLQPGIIKFALPRA